MAKWMIGKGGHRRDGRKYAEGDGLFLPTPTTEVEKRKNTPGNDRWVPLDEEALAQYRARFQKDPPKLTAKQARAAAKLREQLDEQQEDVEEEEADTDPKELIRSAKGATEAELEAEEKERKKAERKAQRAAGKKGETAGEGEGEREADQDPLK